ncbi:MAG: LicD family protein [Lachnospiraceae bacterium]|nr:LicD family protein [Lachnospiraceae bacterium]
MHFEDSYFKNEVRDGFLIPGMVKRSWAMQMEILEKVADICKRHHLKWFADYGTLIGAVRHKGFIPWDDDLDICMLREDYDQFHLLAKKELPEEYIVNCVEDTDDYDNFLLRITKGSMVSINLEYLRQNHGFPYCAGIDIFPLDYLYEDEEKEKKRLEKVKKLIEISEMKSDEIVRIGEKKLIMRIEAYSGLKVDRSIPLYDALVRIVDKLFKEAPSEGAKRVAVMYFYTKFGKQIRPMEYYEKSIEVPFETGYINIPARYDEVLTLEYGSWGVANRRGGLHDYPFFSLHEQKLYEENGAVPYRFEMDRLLPTEKQERMNHYLECDKNANILSTLQTVHSMIENLIWQEKWDEAMTLCSKCQELAVLVGNNVEASPELQSLKGKPELVTYLEEYCEGIFHLYEAFSVGGQTEAAEQNSLLSDLIPKLQYLYKKHHREKKQVLFLPVTGSDWALLKPFYDEQFSLSEEDEKLEIYVMPLPYYDRGNDGNVSDAYWDYESFSKELPLVDYHQVNLEQFHFEKIYFCDPYDAYQSGMTVDPAYYSDKLYRICDELILIDTLNISDPLDEKTTVNLKHYVLTPGMMRADQVIVPDEDTKKAFEQILAGNKNGAIEKDIYVDQRLITHYAWEKVPGEKKKLLFFTSIADFYGHAEKLFTWLDSRLDVLEESKDRLQIFWVEPAGLQDSFLMDCPDETEAYCRFRDAFRTRCDGTIILEAEAEMRIDEFDAFYGSPGFLLNQCARRKMPVMVRNMGLKI